MATKLDVIVTDCFKVHFDSREMRRRNIYAFSVYVTDQEPTGYAFVVNQLRGLFGEQVRTEFNQMTPVQAGYNGITVLMRGPIAGNTKLLYEAAKEFCEHIYSHGNEEEYRA